MGKQDKKTSAVTLQQVSMTATPNVMHSATIPGVSEMIKDDNLRNRLAVYAEKMAVGLPTTVEEGSFQQVQLWNTIKWVLGLEGGDFVRCYSKLLEFVLANRRGIFSERYAYRFFENMKLPSNERKNFERIMNLLLATCDPRTRALSMRQIDMASTLGGMVDPLMQQRIVGYYQL